MASIMGQRMQRAGLEQQTHRDLVNEMYNKVLMGKAEAETKRLEPTIPFKIGDESTMVSRPEYIQLKKMEDSAKGTLQKEYEFYAGQTNNPMGIEDYMQSKNTWIQQYKYYAFQQMRMNNEIKTFDVWQKDQRRAGAMSIDYQAEKAGAVAGATAGARAEVKYLGPDLRNDAIKNIPDLFMYDTEEEKETAIAGEMEKLLKATFPGVERWTNDKGAKGWMITKSDGTQVFKER